VAPGTHPSISAGGRYVTFTTTSALSGQDRDERSDIYRYDARTRDFLLISESESVQDAVLASISADGCVVAWQSVSGQEGRLLVRDLRRPDDSGPPAADTVPAETNAFALSGDGRYVAYASQGSKLPPGDTIPRAEIFVFDRQTKVTDRVSISSTGDEANHGAEWWVWISPDARYVLFPSESTNLDSTDSRRGWFMRDRQEKRTWRVAKVPEPGDDPAEG
jgi:Tol biopolymer transport system component